MQKLVVVKEYTSEIEAHIGKGALEAQDIKAIILTDDAGGMEPSLAFANGVRLVVLEEDLEKAKKIVNKS